MTPEIATIIEGGSPFRLGEWLVEPSLNRVSNGGSTAQLELKAMDVLLCLARHPGEVVDKRVLTDTVWATEFISDNTLARRIAELRDALGDDARDPRYIETITKRGYRLIAEMSRPDDHHDDVADISVHVKPRADSDRSPYPGLVAFTEADANNFFGRETEVSDLWRKITSRRLLAVIGPSGVGKSSLIRAGVMANAPAGWRAVVCQPGEGPFVALAQALAPDFAEQVGEVQQLLRFHDPDTALATVSRWSGRWNQSLIVVDQFEELFTLNPPELQLQFIDLLRRLVDAANVHVLLVMRDDFLFECQSHSKLAPIFSEITPVGPPTGAGLRRALEQPAASRSFSFESDQLVSEMVSEVEEERGALPLLAFAVAQMWKRRDRANRLLTGEAYKEIGGVTGALAQHAEKTLEAIGQERLPIVRELFRNLVTAKGTRATREVGELLSVFNTVERGDANEVLRALIDARLLTTFDANTDGDGDDGTSNRVEFIHESLLSSWPRLVRWQAQDADGALLRDQLRQTAALWDERGRPVDLLWTGSSLREFSVWRERYPGRLSATEQAFSSAMLARAGRRRKRQRLGVGAVLLVVLAVAATTTVLWHDSRRQTRRAQANALFRHAQASVQKYPHGALGAALTSLKMVDDEEVRRFAVQALQRGPKGRIVWGHTSPGVGVDFSPDGQWLAVGYGDGSVRLLSKEGGDSRQWNAGLGPVAVRFTPDSKGLFTAAIGGGTAALWSVPDGARIRTMELPRVLRVEGYDSAAVSTLSNLLRVVPAPAGAGAPGDTPWRLDLRPLAVFSALQESMQATGVAMDPMGRRLVFSRNRSLYIHDLDDTAESPSRLVGRSDALLEQVAFHPDGERVAAVDMSGRALMWSLTGDPRTPVRVWPGIRESTFWTLRFDPTGDLLFATDESGHTIIWGMDDPPDADPMQTITSMSRQFWLTFSPDGRWFAQIGVNGLGVYPFDRERYGWVMRGHESTVEEVRFGPDGDWLVSASLDGTVRLWTLDPATPNQSRILCTLDRAVREHLRLGVAPNGVFVAVTTTAGGVRVVPVDGSLQRELLGLGGGGTAVAIAPDSRRIAAAAGGLLLDESAEIRIWDLESGEIEWSDLDVPGPVWDLEFSATGELMAAVGDGELRRYQRVDGAPVVVAHGVYRFSAAADGDLVVALSTTDPATGAAAAVHDTDSRTTTPLHRHGEQLWATAVSPDGTLLVTGSKDRAVRVASPSVDEPHLLFGHEAMVHAVAISPDGRWVASGSRDGTVRLWRVPTGTPIQALPLEEFLARMYQHCQYDYVEDPASPIGARMEPAPFAGWSKFPDF